MSTFELKKRQPVCIVSRMAITKLLTTSEAAEKLGVTRWRVNALIRDGRLKATKVGQIFLIEEKDLIPVMDRKPGRPPKSDQSKEPTSKSRQKK